MASSVFYNAGNVNFSGENITLNEEKHPGIHSSNDRLNQRAPLPYSGGEFKDFKVDQVYASSIKRKKLNCVNRPSQKQYLISRRLGADGQTPHKTHQSPQTEILPPLPRRSRIITFVSKKDTTNTARYLISPKVTKLDAVLKDASYLLKLDYGPLYSIEGHQILSVDELFRGNNTYIAYGRFDKPNSARSLPLQKGHSTRDYGIPDTLESRKAFNILPNEFQSDTPRISPKKTMQLLGPTCEGVERIAAKQGDTLWLATVKTSDIEDAGSDNTAYITLYGDKGKTSEINLGVPVHTQRYYRNSINEADFRIKDVGDLYKIRIGHDNDGNWSSWHLESVILTNLETSKEYNFDCNQWLSREKSDGKIFREFAVKKADQDIQPQENQHKDKQKVMADNKLEAESEVKVMSKLSGKALCYNNKNQKLHGTGQGKHCCTWSIRNGEDADTHLLLSVYDSKYIAINENQIHLTKGNPGLLNEFYVLTNADGEASFESVVYSGIFLGCDEKGQIAIAKGTAQNKWFYMKAKVSEIPTIEEHEKIICEDASNIVNVNDKSEEVVRPAETKEIKNIKNLCINKKKGDNSKNKQNSAKKEQTFISSSNPSKQTPPLILPRYSPVPPSTGKPTYKRIPPGANRPSSSTLSNFTPQSDCSKSINKERDTGYSTRRKGANQEQNKDKSNVKQELQNISLEYNDETKKEDLIDSAKQNEKQPVVDQVPVEIILDKKETNKMRKKKAKVKKEEKKKEKKKLVIPSEKKKSKDEDSTKEKSEPVVEKVEDTTENFIQSESDVVTKNVFPKETLKEKDDTKENENNKESRKYRQTKEEKLRVEKCKNRKAGNCQGKQLDDKEGMRHKKTIANENEDKNKKDSKENEKPLIGEEDKEVGGCQKNKKPKLDKVTDPEKEVEEQPQQEREDKKCEIKDVENNFERKKEGNVGDEQVRVTCKKQEEVDMEGELERIIETSVSIAEIKDDEVKEKEVNYCGLEDVLNESIKENGKKKEKVKEKKEVNEKKVMEIKEEPQNEIIAIKENEDKNNNNEQQRSQNVSTKDEKSHVIEKNNEEQVIEEQKVGFSQEKQNIEEPIKSQLENKDADETIHEIDKKPDKKSRTKNRKLKEDDEEYIKYLNRFNLWRETRLKQLHNIDL